MRFVEVLRNKITQYYDKLNNDCIVCAFRSLLPYTSFGSITLKSRCVHLEISNEIVYTRSRLRKFVSTLIWIVLFCGMCLHVNSIFNEKRFINFWFAINEMFIYISMLVSHAPYILSDIREVELNGLDLLIRKRKLYDLDTLLEKKLVTVASQFFDTASIGTIISISIYQALVFFTSDRTPIVYYKLLTDVCLYYILISYYAFYICMFLYYTIIFGKCFDKIKLLLIERELIDSSVAFEAELKTINRFYKNIIANFKFLCYYGYIPLLMSLTNVTIWVVSTYSIIVAFGEIAANYYHILHFFKYFIMMAGFTIYFSYMQNIMAVVSTYY